MSDHMCQEKKGKHGNLSWVIGSIEQHSCVAKPFDSYYPLQQRTINIKTSLWKPNIFSRLIIFSSYKTTKATTKPKMKKDCQTPQVQSKNGVRYKNSLLASPIFTLNIPDILRWISANAHTAHFRPFSRP